MSISWFKSFKAWLHNEKKRPRKPIRKSSCRLDLESLEGRIVPATVNWINAGSGNWDVGANWSSGNVPGAGDIVFINTSSAATITIQYGDVESVQSLTTAGNDTLSLSGGSLTVAGSSGLSGPVAIAGGTLIAAGNVSVGAALSESNGLLTGAGTVTVDGLLTWTGGSMAGSGTTLADGGLQLGVGGADSYEFLDARTLQNAGSGTWASTNSLYQNANSVFQNLALATLVIQNGVTTNSSLSLENQGTITVEAGTGANTFIGFVSNDGSIEVSSGTLFLGGAGNVTGSFTVDAGATLQFGGTQYVFNSGAGLNGAGTVDFGTPFEDSATTFDVGSSYNVSGTTNIQDGDTAAFDAAASTGTLNESSGVLGGSGVLTVTGLTTWTGGTMSGSGTTDALGGLSLGASGDTSDAEELAGRTLINAGTGVFYGPDALTQEENSTFVNGPNATLEIEGGANWGFDYLAEDATGTFDNQGAVIVANGSDSTAMQTYFINAGSVAVNSGTLQVGAQTGAGGTVAGSFSVASGATLLFGNADYTAYSFTSTASISGAGTVEFGSGVAANFAAGSTYDVTGTTVFNTSGAYGSSVDFSAGSTVDPFGALTIEAGDVNFSTGSTITAGTLNMSGGTLAGSDTLDVTGLATWTGGVMAGSGTTVAEGGLTLGVADSGSEVTLQSRTLINQETANWLGTGTLNLFDGCTFSNPSGATFNEEGDSVAQADFGVGIEPSGVFNNEGTFTVAAGTGSATMQADFYNEGQVEIGSGTWVLSGSGESTGTVAVNSGALPGLEVNTYYGLTSANITGAGSYTIIDGDDAYPLSFGGGDIPVPDNGPSYFISQGDATVGSLDLTSGGWLTVTGTLTVTGPMVWNGGYIVGPGTIIAEGGLQIGESIGDQQWDYGTTLINTGTGTLYGASEITLSGGAVLINEQGASLAIQGGDSNQNGSDNVSGDGTAILYNQGSISAAIGTGYTESIFNINLVNSGSIAVTTGTLDLETGGTNTGSFSAAAGSGLNFDGAAFAFNAGSSVSGAGTIQFPGDYWYSTFNSGSTYDVTGTTNVQNEFVFFLAGSDVEDLGAVTLSGGILELSSGATDSAASLTQSYGVLNGSDTLDVSGLTTWTGGVMSGTGATVANGGLLLETPVVNDDEFLAVRTLDDAGGGTLESGDVFIQYLGSTFVNPASATLNVENGVAWTDYYGGTATICNQGTLIVAAGADTASIGGETGYFPFLDNTGEVEIASGTLDLGCDGSIAGSFAVDDGATLDFEGDFTLGTGASVVGLGTVEVPSGDVWVTIGASYNVDGTTTIDGGTVEFDGSASTGTLNESSGYLIGFGTLTVTGSTIWTGGTMAGAGTTLAAGGLQINVVGDTNNDEFLYGHTLSNAGTAIWAPGGYFAQAYGGTFINEAAASLTIDNDLAWYDDGTGTLLNAGSLVVTAGSGTATLDVALDNTGSVQVQQGTLSLQGGSNFALGGGTYLVLEGATLIFGSDDVTTTSVALPGAFTSGPLAWAGIFSGTAQDNSGSGLASVGLSLYSGTDYWDGTAFESSTQVFNATALSGDSWTYSILAGNFTSDLAYTAASEATDNDAGLEPSAITSILLAPMPALSGISLTSGPAGGGTTVMLTGTNLAGATSVQFGSNRVYSFVSDTANQIVVASPAGTGTVDVTVTTPAGTSATEPNVQFTYGVPSGQLIVTDPSVVLAGTTFMVAVQVETISGTVVSAFDGNVAIELVTNPGASVLGGTLSVSADDGVASFADLTLNNTGIGYTLQVQAVLAGETLTATTLPFAVSPAAATPFTQSITAPVSAVDANGNALSYTAQVGGSNALFALQQQYDLTEPPQATNFFYNARGGQEKYVVSGNGSNPAGAGYYFLLPNGNLYAWDNDSLATSEAAGPVATLPTSVYGNPTQLTLIAVEQQLDLMETPGATNYYYNTRGADEKYLVSGNGSNPANAGYYVLLPNGNLYAWDSQTLAAAEAVSPVAVLPTYVYADPTQLIDTAPYLASAYNAQQDLDLRAPAPDYYYNTRGAREKYLISGNTSNSSNGGYYVLMPTGSLYAWVGSLTGSLANPPVATLPLYYYQNPALLIGAIASGGPTGLTASIAGGNLIVSDSGFVGSATVAVTATSGTGAAIEDFLVTFADPNPPTLSVSAANGSGIGTAATTVASTATAMATLTPSTGATYSSLQVGGANTLFALEDQYDLLESPGVTDYNYNARGADEKYLVSGNSSNPAGAGYYFLLPNGNLYAWDNNSLATSEAVGAVATLGSTVYADPAQLTLYAVEQQFDLMETPGVTNYFYNARGGQEKYLVSGNGSNPAGGGYYILLPNGSLYAWDNVSLAASAAAGPVATLDTAVYADPSTMTGAAPAYMLSAYTTESTLDLQSPGSGYFYNVRDAQEKYFVSGNGNNAANGGYYVLMPNGNLYAWVDNSLSASLTFAPVATLPTVYYQNPGYLLDAAAPGGLLFVSQTASPTSPSVQTTDISASISGNTLYVTDTDGYLGTVLVYVTIGDGALTTTETFQVTFT